MINMRKEKADSKKSVIDHNLAAVRRMKEMIEDNTTTNYLDLIYVKNLRNVQIKLFDLETGDRDSVKKNFNVLLNRSRVDKRNLKYVSKDDFDINNIYRKVLTQVGE